MKNRAYAHWLCKGDKRILETKVLLGESNLTLTFPIWILILTFIQNLVDKYHSFVIIICYGEIFLWPWQYLHLFS